MLSVKLEDIAVIVAKEILKGLHPEQTAEESR